VGSGGPQPLPRLEPWNVATLSPVTRTTIGAGSSRAHAGFVTGVPAAGQGASPWFFVAKFVAKHSFKLGQWLRGRARDSFGLPLPGERKQKREYEERVSREHWHLHMMGTFWRDMLVTELPLISANGFDQLAGGGVSHGVVPTLTPDARQGQQQMLREIDGRWQGYVQRLAYLEDALSLASTGGNSPDREALRESIRKEIQELDAKMQADLEAVVAFDANPANWHLTPEQVTLLPDAWQQRFERKNELEASIEAGRATASTRAELAALQEEMTTEAGDLYEYGPRGGLDSPPAAGPAKYGPPSP
jgi:hypothetical protein